jgi:hypothetical protein
MARVLLLNDFLAAQSLRAGVGDVLEYRGYVHSSVGNELGYELLSGGDCLAFLGENRAYHTPENMREGWTGGDGATATLSFRAVAAGEVSLRFLHYFRGDVEESYALRIAIEQEGA